MSTSSPAVRRVLEALERTGHPPRRSGAGWKARCPAHEDRVPSLSIGAGHEGRVVIKCHAGCDTSDVVAALGLEMRDLFEAPASNLRETRFQVRDTAGGLVAVHVRRDGPDGKKLYWERDGKASLAGLPVTSLPLYGSELAHRWTEGQPVLLVEGEKAADSLMRHELAALGTVCGADVVPGPEVLEVLRGHDVVLWPDADQPGLEHMRRIAAQLVRVAGRVRWFEWTAAPEHGDAHDYFALGGTLEGLRKELEGAAAPAAENLDIASAPQPARHQGPHTFPPTDYGNAQRLVVRHGLDLRYVHAWGEWLVWDGRRWLGDATGEIVRRAKDSVRAIYREAADGADPETRKRLADHARKSEAEPRLRYMVELTKTEPGIPVTPDQLDTDPWLLNCLNGIVDLKTGQLRGHRCEDLITRLAPADFDPDATDSEWDRVVSEACGGSAELEAFLARALGYSVTGDTSEEKFFFVHGPSASGKSTVMETVKAVLGDYAVTTDFETFLKRDQAGGPRNDLARLAGARFVSSLEVEHGKRLAEGLVKQLTGGDTVSARFLHREFFEFKPQMKLWLAANHAPRVRSDDEAMWRRIVRIPFEHVIAEDRRDLGLKSRLRNSVEARRAILAWLVRGCLAWQREGLSVPPMVRQATAAYREEMDPLQDFIADRCVLDPTTATRSSVLWSEYQAWAKEAGEKWPLTRKQFGEALRACGLKDGKLSGNRAWHGVGLVSIEPRADAGAARSPAWPRASHEHWTDGTDQDVISEVLQRSLPLREKNLETLVPSRLASSPPLPALEEWDREMNPWLVREPGGPEESQVTPADCPERLDAGLEAGSGEEQPSSGDGHTGK